jgi:hypothetical protein
MFKKILMVNRGDNGRQAVAAKPNCMACAARTADLDPMEPANV